MVQSRQNSHTFTVINALFVPPTNIYQCKEVITYVINFDIRFPAFSLARRTHAISFTTMVKERVSIFVALRKNGRHKPFSTGTDRGRNRCFSR